MKTFHNLKISSKVNIIVLTALLLFAIIVGLLINWKVDASIRTIGLEKVKTDIELGYKTIETKYRGYWRIENDQLYKGDIRISNNGEFLSYISKVTNDNVSIYLNDRIASTTLEKNGKKLYGLKAPKEVIEKTLKKGETYFGETTIDGVSYQAGYKPIKDVRGNIIGLWHVSAPITMVDDIIEQVFYVILISSIALIIISFVLVMLFTNTIKKRLKNISLAMDYAGHGDFTHTLNDSHKDEIGLLSQSYMSMRDQLSKLLIHIKGNSELVAASAEQLNASSEETSKATDSISASIQDVAASSDSQIEHVKILESTSTTMVENINKISQVSTTILKDSEANASEALQGGEMMNRTMKQVNLINDTTQNSSKIIHHLGEKSKEINSIINIITEIAEQTNLLALNAAIEAARAGEQGRGFSVVADEVRKLAEQSNQSANQIKELINDIQLDINESVISMDEGRTAIKEGLHLASQAHTSLISISDSVQNMFTQVQNVSSAINEIQIGTKEMDKVVQFTVKHIDNTSELTQTVAASAEEQNAAMQEVSASAHALSKLSEELADSIKSFKFE